MLASGHSHVDFVASNQFDCFALSFRDSIIFCVLDPAVQSLSNMDSPHQQVSRVFLHQHQDAAFVGSPYGSEFAECTLCDKKFSVAKRGVIKQCQQHAQSNKHKNLVKSLLDRSPDLIFLYENKPAQQVTDQNQQLDSAIDSKLDASSEEIAADTSVKSETISTELQEGRLLEEATPNERHKTAAIEGK